MGCLLANIGECGILTAAFEWGEAQQHLVQQHTVRPPVDGRRVADPADHLRRDVLLRA